MLSLPKRFVGEVEADVLARYGSLLGADEVPAVGMLENFDSNPDPVLVPSRLKVWSSTVGWTLGLCGHVMVVVVLPLICDRSRRRGSRRLSRRMAALSRVPGTLVIAIIGGRALPVS